MDLDDPITVALAIADGFRAAEIEYALYGALALAAYGEARETHDADLVVVRTDAQLVKRMLADRAIDSAVTFENLSAGGLILSRVTLLADGENTGLNTVDLVKPRDESFARRALARAIDTALRGQEIRLLSPEDFVLFKALSTRDRDLADAASVVRELGDKLSTRTIEDEVAALGSALPGLDIRDRWQEIQRRAATTP